MFPFNRPFSKGLPNLKQVRRIGLMAAIPVVVLSGGIGFGGLGQSLISRGPVIAGHGDLDCVSCHTPARGTTRQQLQLNVRYVLGLSRHRADFGYVKVSSEACLACHQRPNERHPIYRFREPRFQEAVSEVEATSCLGCHDEHNNQRVSVEIGFCRSCHAELDLKLDPLDVPHDQLIAEKDWQSCLGCHDFHGNHKAAPPVRRLDALQLDQLLAYLKDGADPYGVEKIYLAVAK